MKMRSDIKTGSPDLDKAVESWLAIDKNEKTSSQLLKMIEQKDYTEVEQVLKNRMQFGTAGLRSAMGPGYACMNDVTIIQTSQGFANYLLEQNPSLAKENGVVIGFDARHNSARFAKLAAVAMICRGIPVKLFSGITPTPFVAYAVLKYKLAAGIMVTASHNPKADNGYKVYWSNGAQIIPPHDSNIASHILKSLEITPDAWDISITETSALKSDPYQEVYDSYYENLKSFVAQDRQLKSSSTLKVTYTPMHGVGQKFMEQSFETFDLKPFISVPLQCVPDPEFPTVTFPNPEEGKSALNLAMLEADANGSPLIIANDPDSDRLACAEKLPTGWKVFNGNELGAILGSVSYQNFKSFNPNTPNDKLYMVASTVSSKFLRSMAEKEGFLFEDSLTGFKWMANYAIRRMNQGYTCLFGYEESIGYMYRNHVMDKDGISAGALLAEFATHCYANNTTLHGHLDSLYQKYGYHFCENSYYLCYEPATILEMFGEIRDGGYPEYCGKLKIVGVRDVTLGFDSAQPDKKSQLPVDASCQMLTFTFENGGVATIRTSGTEPKIKYYAEVINKSLGEDGVEGLQNQLRELVDSVVKNFLQPKKFNLTPRPL